MPESESILTTIGMYIGGIGILLILGGMGLINYEKFKVTTGRSAIKFGVAFSLIGLLLLFPRIISEMRVVTADLFGTPSGDENSTELAASSTASSGFPGNQITPENSIEPWEEIVQVDDHADWCDIGFMLPMDPLRIP